MPISVISFKASKTLSGIETFLFSLNLLYLRCASFKASKTLSGIEIQDSFLIGLFFVSLASKPHAGEKGTKHDPMTDPPRQRSNQRQDRDTMANDRPPIVGTVGRNSGQIRPKVCDNTQQSTIQPQVESTTLPNTTVYNDESDAYNRIPDSGCERQTVCHSQSEYAHNDDQDGCCEIHGNTMEGIWVGVCNFVHPLIISHLLEPN